MTEAIKNWLCLTLVVALASLLLLQTQRLHTGQLGAERVRTTEATGRADRATAYAADSDKTATLEHAHATATQTASDTFTAGQPAREAALRSELAAAERLRLNAERRAATDRAQAQAIGDAAVAAQDRIAALERSLAGGLHVVARHRNALGQRDAEVGFLCARVNADQQLMLAEPDACRGIVTRVSSSDDREDRPHDP